MVTNFRCVSLVILILFGTRTLRAQRSAGYLQAKYKVRLRDTSGTYLQLINYYDRTYYCNDIYLKNTLTDGSAQYFPIVMDKETKIGVIPNSITTKTCLQIGRSIEIKNVAFKKGKLNRLEIRNEGGFVSLPLRYGRTAYKQIDGVLINAYDSSQTKFTLPFAAELARGKYFLELKTIPKIKKSIYLKPSSIFYYPIYRPVLIRVLNPNRYKDYKIYYSSYPYKKYRLCSKGLFEKDFEMRLQPKKLYEFHYRKKGRRWFRKKKFYLDTYMDVLNLKL